MKKYYLISICLLLFTLRGYSQCSETASERVMLIGDSWAALMNTDSTFSSVFKFWGHSDKTYYTNGILSQSGATTTDFVQPAKLQEIQAQLLARPSIDFVQLSLGGNDVLLQWKKTWSQAKTDSLLDSVSSRLNFIIDFIKVVRPGIQIVWSGYAYPNFGEIIGDLAPFQTTHPFYATWNGMGQPTFTELNAILNYYSATIEVQANTDPQLNFINSVGLLQYTFGQNINLTVPPGGNYASFTAPLPLGFPDYPTPKLAMRNYVIFKDCFHLSPAAFNDFISYQTRKFYHKALMHDQYLISEGGMRDGSVTSSGTTSASLMLGSSGGDDYNLILSFNTTLMPDTGVSAAALFLRRQSLSGLNPVNSNMTMHIVSGNFGASADIEASDFGDPGNGTAMPCQFGTANADDGWIRLQIPSSLLNYIDHTGITQFSLSVPGASGVVTFTDASDPELAPTLDITYGPKPTGLFESPVSLKPLKVYPNPTTGIIYLGQENTILRSCEIYDFPGKMLLNKELKENYLDISDFPAGAYLVKVYDFSGGYFMQKVIKK